MKTALSLTLALLLAGLVGCSTVHTRIEEKAAVFNSLDPQIQARIRQGLIDVGYTEDMVYIAMGKPDEVRQHTTSKGDQTTWIYNAYWQEYEGTRMVGYRRRVYFDPVARAYRVFYEPVRADVYSDRTEERTRVVFKDGKVASIEQVKD